jgi:hypothetical protein
MNKIINLIVGLSVNMAEPRCATLETQLKVAAHSYQSAHYDGNRSLTTRNLFLAQHHS